MASCRERSTNWPGWRSRPRLQAPPAQPISAISAGEGALHVVQAVAPKPASGSALTGMGTAATNAGDGGKHGVHRLARVGSRWPAAKRNAGAGGAQCGQNRRRPGIWRCRRPGVGHQEGASLVQGKKITGLVGSVGGHEQLSGGARTGMMPARRRAGHPQQRRGVGADVLVI